MAKLNHIALLVSNIESFLKVNSLPLDLTESIEEFPSEGTRELYIGANEQLGRLLIMQAIGDGPYKDALNKRGVGLHHIAIDVPKVDDFVGELAGTGWFLHPRSLWFYDDRKQVFLARPGVPLLVEVQERKKMKSENYFIESIELPMSEERLISSLECERVKAGKELTLAIAGKMLIPTFD